MNKLLLAITMLISVGPVHGMDSTCSFTKASDFAKASSDRSEDRSLFSSGHPEPVEGRRTELEKQPTPMTLAQLYYHFSHDLELLPEIAQHIFFLQCGDSNLTEIEQNCKHPELLVIYIEKLISSCEYLLASEICECYFKHNKISLCDIQNHYKYTCLFYGKNPKVTQILLKIAGNNVWKLLTIQNTHNATALHFAAGNNYTETIKLLLHAAGDNAYELLAMRNDNKRRALYTAIFNLKDIKTVKLLLDAAGKKAQNLIMEQSEREEEILCRATPEINEILQSYMINNKAT